MCENVLKMFLLLQVFVCKVLSFTVVEVDNPILWGCPVYMSPTLTTLNQRHCVLKVS